MDTYEKKYKEALELARVAVFNGHQSLMEGIFPELKESEDERIRKELIKVFSNREKYLIDQSFGDITVSEILTWLEKQGDSPIKWNKNTEGNKPQVNHSVLMKTFQGISEGEWKGEYWEQYRWAGIVRDSDVLSWMELSDLEKQGKQKPTLRERYKNIAESEWFKKTHEGMSVSDDEKVDNVNKIEQKPAWSEEDEKEYKYVLKFVDNVLNNCGNKKDYDHCKRCYDWLKSLKQRIGG